MDNFSLSHFKFYPEDFITSDNCYMSCDISYNTDNCNDKTVFLVADKVGDKIYILDLKEVILRGNYFDQQEEVKSILKSLVEKYNCKLINC